jgi:ABC-type nitrate/sulfonate/bicarbonate transport system substrate-binding protein
MLAVILLQTLTLVVSGPATSPEYLPLHVAQTEGYFAREGLAVTLRTTRAEPGAAEALAQGQADLVATSLDAILRFGPRLAGQTPRLVLGLTAAPPVLLVVADAHKTVVRSIEDLPGTRIGVSTPGAPEQAWFAWLLARAGLSLAQMWMVSRGERGVVQAVESGDVHAALVHEPAATGLVQSGQAQPLVDLRSPAAVRQAIGAVTVNAAVFVRSDRLPRERDLTAFARAVLAAQRRIVAGGDSADTAGRETYLRDGLVTVEQVRETLVLIRAHLPLPVTARVPQPEDLLHVEPARRAVTRPAAR